MVNLEWMLRGVSFINVFGTEKVARYVECQEFIYLFELPAADDRYRVIVAYLQQHRY